MGKSLVSCFFETQCILAQLTSTQCTCIGPANHIMVLRMCAGMDTRTTEDNTQYESKQHLSSDLFEKAVSTILMFFITP